MKDNQGTTELELLALIRSGSDETLEGSLAKRRALEELLELHYPWITRLCLLEFNHSAAALDCVQEIMLRITNGISKFRGDSALRTWMFTIAKRTIYEVRRKERSRKDRILSFLKGYEDRELKLEELAVDNRVPEDACLKLEGQKHILHAISTLAEMQRYAVMLHYFEDLSVEDIAEQLGCSAASVKTHLFRGRKKLKTLLEQDNEGRD
jgi:RNA polymerase sigma-70 factor (ECF subfamily)